MSITITVRNAANESGLSIPSIHNKITSGKLVATKIGQAYQINRASFEQFLEERSSKSVRVPAVVVGQYQQAESTPREGLAEKNANIQNAPIQEQAPNSETADRASRHKPNPAGPEPLARPTSRPSKETQSQRGCAIKPQRNGKRLPSAAMRYAKNSMRKFNGDQLLEMTRWIRQRIDPKKKIAVPS